jgi:hypothetical protein
LRIFSENYEKLQKCFKMKFFTLSLTSEVTGIGKKIRGKKLKTKFVSFFTFVLEEIVENEKNLI